MCLTSSGADDDLFLDSLPSVIRDADQISWDEREERRVISVNWIRHGHDMNGMSHDDMIGMLHDDMTGMLYEDMNGMLPAKRELWRRWLDMENLDWISNTV